MEPHVSVLLPTHNRADVIGFAISSVLAQTETSFELLIVGDGCTDDTAAIVAGLEDPRIRWFDLPKAPYFGYANRNIALRQARGAFIAFAAHDDLLFPDHLARLIRQLEATDAEWAYSRPLWASPAGTVVPLAGNLHNEDELAHFLAVENFIPACCVLYRRSCVESYGYWPEDATNAGDWLYWRRIIEGGARRRFTYLRTPTTLHFKADWRDGFHPSLAAFFAAANGSAWWPKALRVPVDRFAPEQATFGRLIADPSSAWVEEARAAVMTVIERLARDHATQCVFEREGHRLADEVAVVDGMLRQKDRELHEVAQQLAQLAERAAGGAASRPCHPPPEFSEQLYLDLHPDVAKAVHAGQLQSGFQHWLLSGRAERRLLRPIGGSEPAE
jgi:hypothetical protein